MENNNSITKTLFISFSAEVNQNTAENLMGIFAQRLNQGIKDFYLLLSSPGGSVMNGITVYNFLKSLPINLTTHNIGIVDSISNVIFLRHFIAIYISYKRGNTLMNIRICTFIIGTKLYNLLSCTSRFF